MSIDSSTEFFADSPSGTGLVAIASKSDYSSLRRAISIYDWTVDTIIIVLVLVLAAAARVEVRTQVNYWLLALPASAELGCGST